MAEQREKFLKGCKANKVQEAKAKKLFELMEHFAEYGFNESHSAAYALLAYHTAYLRASAQRARGGHPRAGERGLGIAP